MGTVSQACLNMKAFVIVALVAAVAGEADPYTIGQVLAGQTNGGVLTSTTYHGGVKVEGFPYTKAVLPAVTYAGWPYAHAGVLYGKREAEAEPWTVGQIAAGAHVAEAIKDGRPHNVGVITNAAIAPVATYAAYPYAHHYPYAYYGKREAEAEPKADPALVYSTGLVGAYPYAVGAHAVTYTPFGVTHSSNVGICTNNLGAVVPCRRKRRPTPTPPWSTAPLAPCPTPMASSPTPASTAPTPSTPLPTPPLASPTPPTSGSAPTTSVPQFPANHLTQICQQINMANLK